MKDIQYAASGDRIRVYKYHTDVFKSESLSIYFELPANKEKSVARSLLLSVLKRGTEKYPSQKHINERLDELYATLVNLKNQKFDGVQLVGISADVIYSSYTENSEDLLGDALEVIHQMAYHPMLDEAHRFCKEYIQSEKENYKSIILSQINEPRTYAAIRCREEMFASINLSDRLEDMCDKIDAVTGEEIYECYRELIKTAKIIVFYVGKRDANDICKQIARIIDVDVATDGTKKDTAPKLLKDLDEPQVIVESSAISQGRLVMGFNCGVTWRDEDYYAMLLCNEILGSSPISKLMMNVREALSLCYECSSVYNSARGAIFVTTGIDCENYELTQREIIRQIEDMNSGKISEVEFEAAKKSILNVYSSLCDSPSAIERFYLGRIINGIDIDIADFLKRIDELSVSDVQRAAQKLSLHTVYFLRGESDGEGDEIYE